LKSAYSKRKQKEKDFKKLKMWEIGRNWRRDERKGRWKENERRGGK